MFFTRAVLTSFTRNSLGKLKAITIARRWWREKWSRFQALCMIQRVVLLEWNLSRYNQVHPLSTTFLPFQIQAYDSSPIRLLDWRKSFPIFHYNSPLATPKLLSIEQMNIQNIFYLLVQECSVFRITMIKLFLISVYKIDATVSHKNIPTFFLSLQRLCNTHSIHHGFIQKGV